MSVHDLNPSSTELATTGGDSLLALALNKGVDVGTIERLVALVERAEARRAEKAYFAALAKFQSECPPIQKTSVAKITTRTGGGFEYRYADLDEIVSTVRPHMHANDLSYAWDSTVSENGSMLTCVCTIRHAEGHHESASFTLPTATSSAMSEQQRYAAALSFAQRKSLVQALGLVATEAAPDTPAEMERISAEQAANMRALLDEIAPERHAKFFEIAGASKVEDVPSGRYAELMAALEKARKGGAK